MIEGNLRLVLSVIQRFDKRGESPDDLFQVGCIGLMKAIATLHQTGENAEAIRLLQELGILKATTNAARNRVFAYEEYLQILRQGT